MKYPRLALLGLFLVVLGASAALLFAHPASRPAPPMTFKDEYLSELHALVGVETEALILAQQVNAAQTHGTTRARLALEAKYLLRYKGWLAKLHGFEGYYDAHQAQIEQLDLAPALKRELREQAASTEARLGELANTLAHPRS